MKWELDKEYPLKCGGKMVPKIVKVFGNHRDGIDGVYIRPDTVAGGNWSWSRWNLDGSHAGGFGHGPDPLLDVVTS